MPPHTAAAAPISEKAPSRATAAGGCDPPSGEAGEAGLVPGPSAGDPGGAGARTGPEGARGPAGPPLTGPPAGSPAGSGGAMLAAVFMSPAEAEAAAGRSGLRPTRASAVDAIEARGAAASGSTLRRPAQYPPPQAIRMPLTSHPPNSTTFEPKPVGRRLFMRLLQSPAGPSGARPAGGPAILQQPGPLRHWHLHLRPSEQRSPGNAAWHGGARRRCGTAIRPR
jgi:hypothetical protein